MLLNPKIGGLVTKMAQSMGFWANLGKNPYFEPFLWLNYPFLGLATFTKVDSMIKMSKLSFIKFSLKLGAQDLRTLVEPLRELTLLNKALWSGNVGCIEKERLCLSSLWTFELVSDSAVCSYGGIVQWGLTKQNSLLTLIRCMIERSTNFSPLPLTQYNSGQLLNYC